MKKHYLKFLMLVCSAIFLPSAFAQTSNMDVIIKKVDATAQQALRTSGAPGLAVAIVQNNQIVFMKAYGVREAGKPATVTTDTVFRIASVSKPFTSTLTGILVDKQLMTWNDRIAAYLPTFALKSPTNTQNLTIKHVLSHTGGLPSHAYDDLIEANLPFETAVARLRTVNPTCAPGQCYNYQNVLYSISADLIKARTGKTFDQQMRERVFIPLGMTTASTTYEAMMNQPNKALPHVKVKNGWAKTTIKPTYYRVAPAGGVNASIKDMANWLRAQMGYRPDVISPAVISTITTPIMNTSSELYKYKLSQWRQARVSKAQYGLGWRIYNYSGHTMVYHRGGLQGYRAEVAYLPKEKVGIVSLWNSETPLSDTLVPTFMDMYLGLPQKNWVQLAAKR